jgi:hypothetical protein
MVFEHHIQGAAELCYLTLKIAFKIPEMAFGGFMT